MVYACADLHGNYWAWEKIKNILNDTDILYCLGDSIDRGPDGILILQEMFAMPNVHYILGNHEDMMLDYFHFERDAQALNQWYRNGGEITHQAFKQLAPEEKAELIQKLKNVPLEERYTNINEKTIVMCHAGYSFEEKNRYMWGDELLWDREHYLNDYWDEEDYSNYIVVHGHTPIPYLIEDKNRVLKFCEKIPENYEEPIPKGAYFYCNGHKIDIDAGTIFTNKAILLNLDTLEDIVFYKDN